jgi:hypothetical protein
LEEKVNFPRQKSHILDNKSIDFFSRITNEIEILLLEVDSPLDGDRRGKIRTYNLTQHFSAYSLSNLTRD